MTPLLDALDQHHAQLLLRLVLGGLLLLAGVTKLADRGSSQTAGIVTDVGLFLHQLSLQIGDERAPGAPRVAAVSDAGSASRRS